MIVQAIGLLDDLDKELNTYAMRVREWYGWHFPELTKIIQDNIQYARAVKFAEKIEHTQKMGVIVVDNFLRCFSQSMGIFKTRDSQVFSMLGMAKLVSWVLQFSVKVCNVVHSCILKCVEVCYHWYLLYLQDYIFDYVVQQFKTMMSNYSWEKGIVMSCINTLLPVRYVLFLLSGASLYTSFFLVDKHYFNFFGDFFFLFWFEHILYHCISIWFFKFSKELKHP